MGENSAIEWTDATWNPVTGCTKVSQGCKYCYAERLALRLRVVAQFRSGHGPIPVLFECYRIRTDSGMPRLDIRFSTSHLMMASTR